MIDDFDFEDDLEDLKDEANNKESSFFPPVKNNQSRLNLGDGQQKSSLSKIDNKGPIFPQSIKSNKFNQNDKDSDDDFGDEYGFDEVKPKAKPQAPLPIPQVSSSKPTFIPTKVNQNSTPILPPKNAPSNKKVDKFEDDVEEEYVNEYEDFDDSEDENLRPKQTIVQKKLEPNPFPSPGFSKEIEDKVRSKPGNINIEDMIRVNSKLDKSSDFDDYNDDLSNLNKPQTPPEITPISQPKTKVAPPPPVNKSVIQSKDKPVTMKTGPIADPVKQKENLRLDTEQKNRLGAKEIDKASDKFSDISSENEDEDKENAFLTQPKEKSVSVQKFQPKNQPIANNKTLIDKDEEPKKMQKPKPTQTADYDDEDWDLLQKENENLIKQLAEFTSQMDNRMTLLKKSK